MSERGAFALWCLFAIYPSTTLRLDMLIARLELDLRSIMYLGGFQTAVRSIQMNAPSLSPKSSRLLHQSRFLATIHESQTSHIEYNAQISTTPPLCRRRNPLHRNLPPCLRLTYAHPPRRCRHLYTLLCSLLFSTPLVQLAARSRGPKSQSLPQWPTLGSTPTITTNRDTSAESREAASCETEGESRTSEHMG